MLATLTRPTAAASDEELVDRVRAGGDGDGEAYGELFERHWSAVRSASNRYHQIADPDDIAQESMIRVLQAIEAGGGPTGSFRCYALSTARNVATSWSRRRVADAVGGDAELEATHEAAIPDSCDLVADRSLLALAFRGIPQRYRDVLWHTVVEDRPAAEVAELLGLSPNCVSVLAVRARESLRRAWLLAQVAGNVEDEDCRRAIGVLVRRERGESLTSTVDVLLAEHLADCGSCRTVGVTLADLGRVLPVALAPLGLTAATVVTEASLLVTACPAAALGALVALVARWFGRRV